MAIRIFLERRRESSSICFEERRIVERRQQDKLISLERRQVVSQIRRYERASLKIPVMIKLNGKDIPGFTQDISPEGLFLGARVPLNIGTSITLQFSFLSVCHLSVVGRVIYNDGEAIRIKFPKIKPWEQKILKFSVEELKQNASKQDKSLLTILVYSTPTRTEEKFMISNLQPRKKKLVSIQNEENLRNDQLSLLKKKLKIRESNLNLTPDPEWVIEMERHLRPYKQAILDCRIVRETSTGALSLREIQGWNIQFYPFIESFPRFIALNLSKVTDSISQAFLIDNVKVEKTHAEYWIDMAKGFGIKTDALFNARILPEVDALTHWLWSINYRGTLVEGVAATNYAIEGVAQGIASTMVKGFIQYNGRDGIFLDKRAYRWMEAHSVYDDLHAVEALEIIKENTDSSEMEQKVRHAAQRSLEYLLRALEACYAAYS